MDTKPNDTHTTHEFVTTSFRPHGLVQYTARGRILETVAQGPFNAELIAALIQMALAIFPGMAAQGRWAQLVHFRDSAMASQETLDALTQALQQVKELGMAPTYSIYVIDPQIEGSWMMHAKYQACFTHNGLHYESFSEEAAAQARVQALLNGAD